MQRNLNRNRKGLLSDQAFLMSCFKCCDFKNLHFERILNFRKRSLIFKIIFQQQQHQGMLLHHSSSVPQSSSKTFLHTFPRNHPQPQNLRTTASGITEQSPVRCCGSNSNR